MVIQAILPKRLYLSAHFGLKYLSNDGISRDVFYRKNFPKIDTSRPAEKKSRANFEWSVPLMSPFRVVYSLENKQYQSQYEF